MKESEKTAKRGEACGLKQAARFAALLTIMPPDLIFFLFVKQRHKRHVRINFFPVSYTHLSIPVNWDYSIPYGLLYSPDAPEDVLRFVKKAETLTEF